MSRVDPDDTQPIGRRHYQRGEENVRPDQPNVGHTPSKAEGDERDVDEALRREERR
jgi:hypothetical protein